MRRGRRISAVSYRALSAICLVILLAGAACSEQSNKQAVQPTPSIASSGGGCAGTVLTRAEPPDWAQGGWTVTKGDPWPVPWAMTTPADAVAYLFATRLVAGPSPRVDGSTNKVLWVTKYAVPFVVDGRPFGKSAPVVTVPGGPSIVDVPSAGCWTFRLILQGGAAEVSTINLDVLPKGAAPA